MIWILLVKETIKSIILFSLKKRGKLMEDKMGIREELA